MKIIITGGCGFIGSAVVRMAVNRGFNVLNLDALTYAGSEDNVKSVSKSNLYTFKKADIRNEATLQKIIMDFKPDGIINLAAESHVDRSIYRPGDFISTNITGTYNLLQSAFKYWSESGKSPTFRFLHVSTDEVFGSLDLAGDDKFSENTRYAPSSPYSASKASSDHLVKAWYYTFGLPTIISNCSNNYGPYHFPEKLIPLVITNALRSKHIPIYGDGANIRDWLYVDDHADALLLLLTYGVPGENYNIGSNNEQSNLSLVTQICKILDNLVPSTIGSYTNLIEFVEDRLGHDRRYAIDASKMKADFNWTAKTSLDEGLTKTINWFLRNSDWWKNRC